MQYRVNDLIKFNSGIVAAGNIYLADTVWVGSSVAFWDGANWSALGSFYVGALVNEVHAIEVYNGELYAGGFFRSDVLSSNFFANLAKWDGTQWVAVPGGSPQGLVHALEVHKGELILAGTFNSIDTLSFDHVAAFDGTQFKPLGNGVPTTVYALESVGDTLFAGGDFLNHSLQDTFGFGYYSNNQWTTVVAPEINLTSWGQSIKCLQNTPYGLFMGGDVRYTPMLGVAGKNLLRYKFDAIQPYAVLDSTVNSLAYKDGLLYVGGMFKTGNTGFSPADTLNHITYYNIGQQFSLIDYQGTANAQVFPNPSKSEFTLSLQEQIDILDISIHDLSGKRIKFEYEEESKTELNFIVERVVRGVYIISLKTNNGTLEKKIILGQ